MSYTRPDFNGALLNFRLFLKFWGHVGLGSGVTFPPAPPSRRSCSGEVLKVQGKPNKPILTRACLRAVAFKAFRSA